jgi:hypothetical protein
VKRWAIVFAVVVIVLGVAGVVGLPLAEVRLADALKARLEQGGTAKVAAVEVGFLQRRIVLKDLAVAQLGDNDIKAAKVEARGLGWPLADLLAGRTPFTGWRWGDPLQAEHVEITDLHLLNEIEQGEWRVARLVFEGLDLPRYEPLASPPPGSLAQPVLALSHLSLRRFEVHGLVFQSIDGEGTGVRIASIVLERLHKGEIDSLALAGSEIRDRPGSPSAWFSVAEIVARKVDLRTSLDKLKDPEWLPGMPTGRASLETLTFKGVGGAALANQGITLGRISYETKRDGERASGRARIEDFVLRPQGLSSDAMQTLALLMSLGVREVKASLDCSGGEDRAKGEIEIDRCVLASPGLGEIALSLKLVNGDEAFWRGLDEGDPNALAESRVGLGAAKLVMRDTSLLERLVNLYATATGLPRPEARAALAREVRRFQPTDMLITEDMTKLADTLARFVEQGGTLTIEAKPDPPLTPDGARVLFAPGPDIVSVLGLSATVAK